MEALKRFLLHKYNPDRQREVFVGQKPSEEELRAIQAQQIANPSDKINPSIKDEELDDNEDIDQYELSKKRLQQSGPIPLGIPKEPEYRPDQEDLELQRRKAEVLQRLAEKFLK